MISEMGGSYMTVSVTMSMTTMTVLSVMLGVMSMSESLNNSIKTAMGPSFIFDYSDCAICLLERVRSFHVLSISVFVLFFLIAGVRVVDSIFKIVFNMALNIKKK